MAEKEKFTPIAGMHHSGARLPLEVFPDVETITVVVPKEFLMNVDAEHSKASGGSLQLRFTVGPQEMPAFLVDHWWVKANGVKVYEAAKKENDSKLFKAPDNVTPQPKVVLEDMTKAELVEHAEEKHELILAPSMKKEDMIAAIQEASEKSDAA
jgi:hypothetical protein